MKFLSNQRKIVSFFIVLLIIFGGSNIYKNSNIKIYLDEDSRCLNSFSKINQNIDKEYYIIGHSYGSHDGSNEGLSKKILSYFKSKNQNLILTGDIVRENSEKNLEIVKKQVSQRFDNTYIAVGNHDLSKDFYKVFKSDLHIFSENNIDFIIANFSTNNWQPSLKDQNNINNYLLNSDNKTIILFSHQIFWTKLVDPEPTPNGFNLLSTELDQTSIDWLERKGKKLIIISGDYGMYERFYCKHDSSSNTIFVANGIYERNDDSFIKLNLVEDGFYFEILNFKNN